MFGKDNQEIRQWYLQKLAEIPNLNRAWVEQGVPLDERALRAYTIRWEARMEARKMMKDTIARDKLRLRDKAKYGDEDGLNFSWLFDRYERMPPAMRMLTRKSSKPLHGPMSEYIGMIENTGLL